MTHVPHDLAADFPELAERIQTLRAGNAHFRRVHDEYDAVNAAVHRAEARLDALSEDAEEALRRHRAALKDGLYQMLTAEDA